MIFYFLFIVFLYAGGINARVVPLDFKLDKSKHVENDLINESPLDEVEILGHSLPDIKQNNGLELSDSEEKNATVLEISNRNASNLPLHLTTKEKDMGEESNLEKAESSVISDVLDEEFKSVSEFMSKNNFGFKDSFETLQVNENLNNKTTEDLIFKIEASITNNSSSRDLEQENNLDFGKIAEKILNDTLNQNETFAASVVSNSDQNEPITTSDVINRDQNEISTIFDIVNDTGSSDYIPEVQSLLNDTKVEIFLSGIKNSTEDFKLEKLASENLELKNDSVQTAGGILSGFEFLINSEVARNAAKAMEVFNFSDPLTDHIMEENEFHSFLPALNAGQGFDSSNQTNLKTAIISNSSGESNEIRADFNTSLPFGDETSIVLNEAEPEEIKNDSSIPFKTSELLEGRNKTLTDLAEHFKGNVTSEGASPLQNSEEKIQLASEGASPLQNSEEKIQLASEATPTKQKINASVSISNTVGFPECPPPGWCIFWFLSQDACAVNEHCLGSRICCKIRCSKTCIEVESS